MRLNSSMHMDYLEGDLFASKFFFPSPQQGMLEKILNIVNVA